jgi:hypothetical protein
MYWDDRPDYPMVFAVHLKLSGNVDRPAFESSFQEALSRHPLLCASVGDSWQSGLVWEIVEQRRPALDWNRIGVPLESSHGERIDLHCEAGLRGWVRQGDESVEVTLQFHHATCDGLGAFQFIMDLLAAYGIRTASGDRCPTLPACDPAILLRRGEFAAAEISAPEELDHSGWTRIRDVARFLGRRSVILPRSAEKTENTSESISFLGVYWEELDSCETARLREASARRGVTMNDLLVRDMFQCLQAWIAERASESAARWIRIAIPVNLRNGEGEGRSAANRVSYNLLTRARQQCEDSDEFLKGISLENQPFLRRHRSLMFLRCIRCSSRIPGAVSLFQSGKSCFATAVLSNLGDINRLFGSVFASPEGMFTAGNLVLESIVAAPPVRVNTRAAFMVHRYAGRFRICLRCDPRIFTAHDARSLLTQYVERLRRSI